MKTNITHSVSILRLSAEGRHGASWWVGLVRCEGTELKYGPAIDSILL